MVPDNLHVSYLKFIVCFVLLVWVAAQSRCEVKMTADLLSSALCKEEDELRQNVEQWNQLAMKLEMLMNELVRMPEIKE